MPKNKAKRAQLPRLLPYQSPLENHPEHVAAIGMISVEMANLDYMLGGLLGALLHVGEEIGRTVYLTPRVAIGRVEIIENVADLSLTGELANRVGSLIKRVRTLVDNRHRMMHDYWGVDIETGMPSRLAIPQKASKPKKLVPLDELTTMIQDIRLLATDARELTVVLYASWPPYASLDKSGLPRRAGRARTTRRGKGVPPAPADPPKPSPE